MRKLTLAVFTTSIFGSLILSGCGGREGDLERARYLLGKGDRASAGEAFDIVAPLRTTASAEDMIEVYRLYAGAAMQKAGFNGISIVANVIYKSSNNTVTILREALDLDASAATYLSDAITSMDNYVASAPFQTSTDTRAKQGLYFQLGLLKFFKVIQNVFQDSGLSTTTGTMTSASCQNSSHLGGIANFSTYIGQLSTYLGSSQDNFTAPAKGNLNVDNKLVDLVDALKTSVDAAQTAENSVAGTGKVSLCNYLSQQSSQTE